MAAKNSGANGESPARRDGGPGRSRRGSRGIARILGGFALAAFAAAAAATGWNSFGGNAQHTGLSPSAAQPLGRIVWSTPVDLAPPTGTILIHYGSPVITPGNTVIIPVKTGADGGFRLDARNGRDGTLVWSAPADYALPPYTWMPSYSPALGADGRVWYAGSGGTVLYRDNLDAALPANSGRIAFYGLANYQQAPASFDSTVFVNTPIIGDASGAIWFGFRTTAGAPLGLASGVARIDAAGNGTWIAASTLSGDAAATIVPNQAAPALSPDGSTLYVVVANPTAPGGYLVGLDPVTLALKEASPGVPMRAALMDPRDGGTNPAQIVDFSSASPMVGPDGDVYYGVLANPSNGSRGWMLHFPADLQQVKTPGGFGWDSTASVVPASAVPSYAGTSSYLIFSKYNDYPGFDGGTGINRIAVLDPNDTMVEPHQSSNGQLVMKIVLAIAGPTPDPDAAAQYPGAVYEWCINAAAVDPATKAVMVNSEDGNVYRWDLATNTLSQAVTLSPGIGEAYTSTQIGPDGTVYATNWAILNAVGSPVNLAVTLAGSGAGSVASTPAGIACGAACATTFAWGTATTLAATPAAGSIFTGWQGACTGLGSCVPPPFADSAVTATFAPAGIAPLRVDVDGDGAYDALTDGLLAIRYLFGLTGTALVTGALGTGATLTDPAQLALHLDDILPTLDIDGDGRADALTDGLILLRYLFGLRGAQLISNAVAPGATRTGASQIEAYIATLMP